jgi:hypothetical protein
MSFLRRWNASPRVRFTTRDTMRDGTLVLDLVEEKYAFKHL